ncbi:bifunctional diaminohydroxyphosphoribosylaminopyrimidine deaminase/5-amino-6-(5-phosphoribosylamino)uracil reductase RibD [Buchnera aphidicola]|uniref:bifunctional diaminohydroxyphosphoribosylaminopyrimidine deaminase/5-amino-6-(5-phosphoribosylamino)uracil reductase RibD n=1 Tax=Buchnera aphidicola TaxID=9 RepID=UPI003464D958
MQYNDKTYKEKYKKDIFYMKKAIKLAKKGIYTTHPNPNVGCIIVNNKKIVGQGWHKKAGDHHAEIYAIQMAGKLTQNSTAYISLEPCNHVGKTPPCCEAIIQSGIKRVVISMLDPNPKVSGKGIQYLKKSGIKITLGIMSKESKEINQGFLKRISTGIPWVTIKMAISVDGKIAMKNGDSKWITSKKSIQNVHKLRATSSAILSTSNTILQDNPKLTVRYKHVNNKQNILPYTQPIRIIIDSKNQIQPNHNIIKENIGIIWLIRLCKDKIQWPNHVKQIIIPAYKNYINFKKLLIFLGKKKINKLWIECGAHLFSNILSMQIIDEIILYIAPKMLGNNAYSFFFNKKKVNINQKPNLIFKNIKMIGQDIRLIIQTKY